jgi:AAA+ ATPase superfamily predicted ATPase
MQISEVERLVASAENSAANLEKARGILRSELYKYLGSDQGDGSFGDAIAQLESDPIQHRRALLFLIRFLGVEGLLPPSNETNRIARNIVSACERSLHDICEFLHIDEKMQPYEKYALIASLHSRICSMLSPLTTAPDNLDGLISNRNMILQALGNGIVRQYCEPFMIANVRAGVESTFRHLKQLNPNSADFILDLYECRKVIVEQQIFTDANPSFLTSGLYRHFLNTADSAVEKFIESVRGRFTASLSFRLENVDVLPKRYPLHKEGRDISFKIPLRNDGPGVAIAVLVEIETDCDSIIFDRTNVHLGNVTAGVFSVSFDAIVLSPCDGFSAMVTVTWEEIGDANRKSLVSTVTIEGQRADIDWVALEHERPYSTDVAKGSAFVGRREKIVALANKLVRNPMESFFLTGQKRIGKTSLAYASLAFAKAQADSRSIETCYFIWGGIAYEDPRKSIAELGREISEFIVRTLPKSAEQPKLDFSGSLAPIARLADLALQLCPNKKYVIAIDEFDEIHPELYMQGNLAETFFANIRAIANCENVCIILIGGENMPFLMSRQGQKLNKFVKVGLDYFSRDTEWEDFCTLVRQPTEGSIVWRDDAISEIFNVTNGNPYFAKIVCAAVYESAVRERDADVTYDEVIKAIAAEVPKFDTNSFIHLWQDGIHKTIADRETDILRRCRVLVAVARTARRHQTINTENIISNKHSVLLSDAEVSPVLNDFAKRDVLREKDGTYSFVLPIFKTWLTEVGISQLSSDAITEELARGVQAAEDAAYVRSDEVEALVASWPPYQGKEITADRVRAWFEQIDGHRQQRMLFKLLRRLRFLTEVEIREKLRTVHATMVRPLLGQFIQKRKSDRRTDMLITYVDGEGKSGHYYASRYAEQNAITAKSILSPSNFSELARAYTTKNGKISAIVIIDDIVATGESLKKNLVHFVRRNRQVLDEMGAPTIVISLLATVAGEENVRHEVSKIADFNFDLRYCELLKEADFAFERPAEWADQSEYEQAKALCNDLGALIYRNASFGYGDQGLLVVFPDTCPNNSLPILHSIARQDAVRGWKPLFPRLVN